MIAGARPGFAGRPARLRARARRGALAVASLLSLLAVGAPFARAQDEEIPAYATPDSVFEAESQPGPLYQTTFDRDKTRNNWSQTLSYFANTGHVAFNASGSATTQEFTLFTNRATFGNFSAHMDARPTSHWVWSLEGRFDMNSTTDGTLTQDSRQNRLQIRTQYSAAPVEGMSLLGLVYTEFQRDHDRSVQERIDDARIFSDPAAVDTLHAQRDSSYTSGRQDGMTVIANWRIKPWLLIRNTGSAGRLRPTQNSLVRDFTNPLDGSGGGYAAEVRQSTTEPTNNSNYQSSLSFSRIPKATIAFGFTTNRANQSLFDKQLRGQELTESDRNAGTLHVLYGPVKKTTLSVDGALVRALRTYRLRQTSNSLVRTHSLIATVARSDTVGRFGITYMVSRNHNERQATQNGIVIDRSLAGNGMRRFSDRFAMDALASVGLFRSTYDDPTGDQDIGRGAVSVGGGYRVSPACSTTVHFSLNRSHGVAIDPSASGANSVQTNYQMNATLRLRMSESFTVSQDYLLSANYKIYDFEASESNNYLNRIRRIDTSLIDSLFSMGFLRFTHNFIFRDSGGYARDPGETERTYRISTETYEQTLAMTAGCDLMAGVRIIATQSLLNQRNHFLFPESRTTKNRFALTAGLEVNRTLRDGMQIVGAVRHIAGYDERMTPTTPTNSEEYWIAGFTVQRQF